MEDSAKNFINTVIFVSRIFISLKDRFLARKLYEKLFNFVLAYSEKNTNVAQYRQWNILSATNALLDMLDYLEHSKSTSATSLLYARRNLFLFKLYLIKNPDNSKKIKSVEPQMPEREEKSSSTTQPVRKKTALVGNKEKIFNYIKRLPNSRAKDIIYEFSVLSERTVKRNLSELIGDGLLQKISKDKAVYYKIK